MASDDKYLFYGHSKKKGVYPQGWMFSNFSPHPVVAYGIKWPTSEHLFQALKFKGSDHEYFNEIAKAKDPCDGEENRPVPCPTETNRPLSHNTLLMWVKCDPTKN